MPCVAYRHGIHGLVIDPYNEINHARTRDMNETEYVSVMMSKVKRFAQVGGWVMVQAIWVVLCLDLYQHTLVLP